MTYNSVISVYRLTFQNQMLVEFRLRQLAASKIAVKMRRTRSQ